MKKVEFTKDELMVLQKIFELAEAVEFEDNLVEYNIFCDMFTKLFGKEMPDLFLDSEELLELDMKTGNIKVDKYIFDDFVANTYINIQFVDDKYQDRVAQYVMVAEDDEGIFMEYMED